MTDYAQHRISTCHNLHGHEQSLNSSNSQQNLMIKPVRGWCLEFYLDMSLETTWNSHQMQIKKSTTAEYEFWSSGHRSVTSDDNGIHDNYSLKATARSTLLTGIESLALQMKSLTSSHVFSHILFAAFCSSWSDTLLVRFRSLITPSKPENACEKERIYDVNTWSTCIWFAH